MPFPLLILLTVLWMTLADCPLARADSHRLAEGNPGCPRCGDDGPEVSRLLQKAHALYADFKSKEAFGEVRKVLDRDPEHPEALAMAARVMIDLGDMVPESEAGWQDRRLKQYRVAEQYARRAIKADPASTWGHFYVAASLGKIALHSPVSEQLDLAQEIRAQVEKALSLDPQNGFAYHIYGVWHREVSEIGQMKRIFSSVFLGRSVPAASMEKSVEYLTKAAALNPTVISHHLELAKTYLAMGRSELARKSLQAVQRLPIQFSDDHIHKKEAERLLQKVETR